MPRERSFGGHSMSAPLRRVLVCRPESAGWGDPELAGGWSDLGYDHPPDAALAARQHARLRAHLEASGAEILELAVPESPSLDAVYVHDPSIVTDSGAICLRSGKRAREPEAALHRAFYESAGIPLLGAVEAPAVAESGDMVWLDEGLLLVGRGFRTNGAGIDRLQSLLGPRGVMVLPAPLPHGPGPEVCLHLMSILSVLDDRVALADTELLAVETVELLEGAGFRLVAIDPAERATQAANVLSLGRRRLLAIEENQGTNDRLRSEGFEVLTFPGSEVCHNGGGGPTCLTRPLLRG